MTVLHRLFLLFVMVVLLLPGPSSFGATAESFGELPGIEPEKFLAHIPIEFWQNKIFLNADINGHTYRFIFDTGSPTVLTERVANELGLQRIGKNQGRDAHNHIVEMDKVIVDSITLGDVTFSNVSVLVFDPVNLPVGNCILDGGIIGSEILPLAKWQFNFKDKRISISDELSSLDYLKGAKKAKLLPVGWPHPPIVPHKANRLTDNALFDTGAATVFSLNFLAYQEMRKQGWIEEAQATAHGSFGESAGGRGQNETQYLAEIPTLSLGSLKIKNLRSWTRPRPPSLIGAKLLLSHIVTLDYQNQAIHFFTYNDIVDDVRSFGLDFHVIEDAVKVSFIVDGSPAASAGLQPGDQILAINGRSLASLDASTVQARCDLFFWLADLDTLEQWDIQAMVKGSVRNLRLTKN